MRNINEVEIQEAVGGIGPEDSPLEDSWSKQQTEKYLRQQEEKDRYESVRRNVVGQ